MRIVDTLQYARRLRDAGVPREQAEAHAAVMADMIFTEVASRADVDQAVGGLGGEMHAAFDGLRGGMAAEFAAVRAEMATELAAVRAEMAAEFAAVREEMAGLRAGMDLRFAGVDAALAALGNRLTLRLGGLMVAGIGVLATLIRLG
jgi:hypothetical protein